MEKNSGIFSQIDEAHGKVLYTCTTHFKQVDVYQKKQLFVKWLQIIVSAITATSLIATLIKDVCLLQIFTALTASFSLAITLYESNQNYSDKILRHKNTAEKLWLVREKYVSLMTDFEELSEEEIREKRDSLMIETNEINKDALPTSKKSYRRAQKAIKKEQEQFFSQEELNVMNPEHLRK